MTLCAGFFLSVTGSSLRACLATRVRAFYLSVVTLCLAGCSIADFREQAIGRAEAAGYAATQVQAGEFELVAFYRGLGESSHLNVYIEGDGHAWETRYRPSDDPTPHNPVSLELALRDPSPAVLYIARPCQYLSADQLERCNRRYWSSHRYSEEVAFAVNAVIDWALQRMPVGVDGEPRVGLVGYSGGGVVAALVAARRMDVGWLVTLAANLDHHSWSELHDTTPLHGSLNPPEFADQLRDVPQLHLSGGRDKNVPYTVLQSYLTRLGDNPAIRAETLPEYNHKCCWPELWPAPLCRLSESPVSRMPACM